MTRRLTITLTTVVILVLVIGLINYKQQPNYLTSEHIQYKIGMFIMKTARQDDIIFADRFENAAKYLQLSVDKGLNDRMVFHDLYVCYDMSHHDDKAEITLDKAIEFYSDDFEFRYLRGEKRKELKKHRLALEDFNAALTIDSTENEQVYSAYYNRGAMTYILGDSLTAMKDWRTACKIAGRELRDYSDYSLVWR
jgi:tetratricopeptide (TPR) repeat protein